ncbi:NmrA family NAD(P)-binding protein [Larkinella harenae]
MINSNTTPFILVIGGTGTQGGNVARELLRHGHRVRVLTRNPTSTEAQQIAAQGADVVKGDLGNLASLLPAMKTITGIFSVPYADPYDRSVELRYARNMVQAAQEMRIGQIDPTSS